jgi:hypothetical protein
MPSGELVGTTLKLTTGQEVTNGHSHFPTMMKYVDDTSGRGLVLNPTRKWNGSKEHDFIISG